MKKTLTTIATVCLLFIGFNSFAMTTHSNPLKGYASTKIVTSYLEAISIGSVDLSKFLFTEDFEYSNTANNSKHNKSEYCKFLKANKGLVFDCKTSYEILDENSQACMAKAIMKFDTFTRVDYITLTNGKEGWKVSKVVTTYP
ncbi:hypothetical protein ACL9RF_01940 [Sphingobacterium sp. Mn56C]|uniref:hypothetical protein n=1 Tax=Sphingobacterium sp. Mn56C TaxID=3395261 RepID=UPI003BDB34CB